MPESTHALPPGHALLEYRIEAVLGTGGFGLTYLATDANLNLRVAVKEYLPGEFALRAGDSTVRPKTEKSEESFRWGLQRFMGEAKALASFRHPNIVRVLRFFEANSTGYMVMEFVEGQSLPEWIAQRRPLSRAALLGVAAPLLDGLEVVHRSGYLHRDIKPANIFIRSDGSPVLIDFGSARIVHEGEEQELTAVVTPGYAPLEQYHELGRQGPWTDLYAFGGVIYWMVTGVKPVEAAARVRRDVMPSAAEKGDATRFGADLLAAVDWALRSNEEDRPRTVAEFRQALLGNETGAAAPVADDRTLPLSGRGAVTARPAMAAVTESGLTGMALDRELLKKVEAELARHIGPIAGVVVRNAAKTSATLEVLCETVGREIPDENLRAAFVRKLTAAERSGPTTGRPPTVSRPTGGAAQPVSAKFTPEVLERAEKALARHIGAIARVVVKQAAAKARDEVELYLLISDEIRDPVERKAFAKKGVSLSGRA